MTFLTPQFAGLAHPPTFSRPIPYFKNQAQKPQCADLTLSFTSSLSPLHSSPSSVGLARSSSTTGSVLRALCLGGITTLMEKKKPSCWDRIAKWAVPAPWQSLPFLVSFCWSKNDFTWNITTRVRWEESAILLGPKWKLWCESHNPLHPHYLFQLE